MSDEEIEKPELRKTDPRLKSFLRQAGAIITAEKGLNAGSRVKLQSLADRLKLPQSLLDEALQRLQSSSLDASALSHYEKAFIKFLDTQFEKLSGGVLSLGMEKNAIDLANRKYQINNARAEQLIQSQADLAGISRISPDEALAFAERTIVDQIGELATVDDELHAKLHKIGKKWGIGTDGVDQLIRRELTINRARRSKTPEKIAVTMLAVAVALGGLWTAYSMGVLTTPDVQPEDPAPPALVDQVTAPSWLSGTMLQRLESLKQSNPRLKSSLETIQATDSEQRQQAYQQLIEATCRSDLEDSEPLNSMLAGLFFLEPDEDVAARIVVLIREFLVPDSSGQTMTGRSINNAYRANRLVGRIRSSPAPIPLSSDAGARIRLVDDMVRLDLGISAPKNQMLADYLAVSEEALATDQWIELMQLSWKSPGRAAAIIESLYQMTHGKLNQETIDQYRDETLLTILKTDNSCWREIRLPIVQSIASCDEIKLSEWISVFSSAGDGSLQDMLGNSILNRIDVRPKTQRRKDVVAAIEAYGTQYRYRVLRPVIDRSAQVDRHFADRMDQGDSASILPDRIAQMALAVNVEFAFCAVLENAAHLDDSAFAEFDRLIAEPQPRLRELISLPIDRRASKSTGPANATASDERRKAASLQRIGNLAPDSTGLRILALNQLERIAHRFKRISYAEGVILADYFLADLGVQERLEIESRIESFSHWPNLALAMADRLAEKEVSPNQALAVTRVLLNREFEVSQSPNWKQDLSLDVLAAVASDLENQIDQDPDNIKSNWIRLKLYLIDCYRQRRAIGLDVPSGGETNLPFQATIDLIDGWVDARPPKTSHANLKRATQLLRQSPLNEIEKSVFANQLLIQFIVAELDSNSRSEEADAVVSALQQSMQETDMPGQHLYLTERALLELLDLKRQRLVDLLLKRN